MMTMKQQSTIESNDATDLIPTASIAARVSAQGATAVAASVAMLTGRPPTNNVSASGPQSDDGLTLTNTKRQLIVKRCETCGWEFIAQRTWARFCSGNCRRRAWLDHNPEKAVELAEKDKARLRARILERGGKWRVTDQS